MAAKRLGAYLQRGPTTVHESVQRRVDAPSPTATRILADAMAATSFSTLHGSFNQVACGDVLASHSQRRRSAKPKNLRSKTPRPPKCFGLHTIGQATLHFPATTVEVPAQRNARRRLSIWSMAHADKQQAMLVCTGMTRVSPWLIFG